jgi:4a-hydroxytetrahydrobiopterin dehydratase
VHLSLVSHSAGGVTESDLELARRIDALLPA